MQPLPFIKAAPKIFKRNLYDDEDDDDGHSSETENTSSSNRTIMNNSSSPSSSAIQDDRDRSYSVPSTLNGTTKYSSSSGESAGNGNRSGSKHLSNITENSSSGSAGTSRSGSSSNSSGSGSSQSSRSTSSTSSSPDGPSSSGSQKSDERAGGSDVDAAGTAGISSASGFFLAEDLDPDDVVDSRTGKKIFERTEREVKLTAPPPAPVAPPTIVVPENAPPSAYVAAAIATGMHTARSSMKSNRTFKSTTRGMKKVRRAALLTLKVGELIVKQGIVTPIAKKGAQEWRSFHAYRDRRKAERRSHTLDWFEERVKVLLEEEDGDRERQQNKRRALWRAHLKNERDTQQLRDFLSETRKESALRQEYNLAKSKKQEKVTNFFLEMNGAWQNDTLTKQVEDDEAQEQKDKDDAHAEIIRDADERRQGAAAAYLMEYDNGEALTQATLRLMRQSGILAGVNALPRDIKNPPLETDTHLLLRLKTSSPRSKSGTVAGRRSVPAGHPNGNADQDYGARQGNVTGIRTSLGAISENDESLVGGNTTDHCRDAGEPTIPKRRPAPSPASHTTAGAQQAPDDAATKPTRGAGDSVARAPNRGKKRSSGAFEVDLLRFRRVEEIRGCKLGPAGGESLAADLANGACPRLTALRLGWNMLGDRGMRALVKALSHGGGASAAGRTLQELDLRGNGITVGGSWVIGKALATGAFPALRDLCLGANALRDEGGRAVAHFLLSGEGSWPRLVRLNLSGNGMRDVGVEAVFKAVTAPGVCLAPDIERINIRNNHASPAVRERTSCAPHFLLM